MNELATVREANGVWTVPLPASAPYPHVRFKREKSDPDYSVVVVDLNVLMMLHDRDHMSIPEPTAWPARKLEGIRNFLDPSDPGEPLMPRVSVWDAPRPGWFARLTKKTHAAVIFGNGRHRARYLRHVGATHIPVEVAFNSKTRLQELCGTEDRRS